MNACWRSYSSGSRAGQGCASLFGFCLHQQYPADLVEQAVTQAFQFHPIQMGAMALQRLGHGLFHQIGRVLLVQAQNPNKLAYPGPARLPLL